VYASSDVNPSSLGNIEQNPSIQSYFKFKLEKREEKKWFFFFLTLSNFPNNIGGDATEIEYFSLREIKSNKIGVLSSSS